MQKISDLLLDNIKNLPIWVKQVIAKEVSTSLVAKLGEFIELIETDSLFQYMVPKLTFKGKQEFEKRNLNLTEGYYLFLESAINRENIFEITVKNNWALADSAKILCRLVELDFVDVDDSCMKDYAVAQFLANKIKTGEFLKRIGKINVIQLEQAIRYQKEIQSEGRHVRMASILIKMGFITDRGLDSLLLLKEESKKRLSVGIGFTSLKYNNEEENKDYVLRLQKELARLENENLIMKKRLKKLLQIDDK